MAESRDVFLTGDDGHRWGKFADLFNEKVQVAPGDEREDLETVGAATNNVQRALTDAACGT